MGCKKMRTYIPDYRIGNLSDRMKMKVERHLAICADCRAFAKSWQQICDLSMEVIAPPADLDWEPFNSTIKRQMGKKPLPGKIRVISQEFWHFVKVDAWNYPRRTPVRLVFSGAAAAFVIFIVSYLQLFTQEPSLSSNLTIGELLISEQRGGMVMYSRGEAAKVHYHEELNFHSLEGIEPQH